MNCKLKFHVLIGCLFFVLILQVQAQNNIPSLNQQGSATQLIVDGKPFLILGGELGNSSASSFDYMKPIWPKLVTMNLNTVLAPVYWETMEPQEGVFDFTLVNGLINQARRYNLRLVLLWFGSWKNSMSCYVPAWIKADTQRFPRARLKTGQPMEILSAFYESSCNADIKAFTALMRHLREVDGDKHTVLMVQVENEIGMLEDARDYSDAANTAFAQPVPQKWMDHFLRLRFSSKTPMNPELYAAWEKEGCKTSGTWEEVFGKGLATDEIFMAWHYAQYVQAVTEAGKAEYPLPMYVNAALNRPEYKPGQYPSAGPLPHLMDIWRLGAPAIDFLSPDIYFPDFAGWARKYRESGNPLFIPEADRNSDCAANVFYAVGHLDAMGFSPFSIESVEDPAHSPIAQSYRVLSQLSPLILANQGSEKTAGVLLDKEDSVREITLGNYKLNISHDYTWKYSACPKDAESWLHAGGIIVSTGPDEYIIAGVGLIVTFADAKPTKSQVGILRIEEGSYDNNKWIPGRILNGDESHQGRHLRIPMGCYEIQRVQLYHY